MKVFKWIGLGALLINIGCAGAIDAPVVRPGEMNANVEKGPFWVAFEPGDKFPLEVDVTSPLVELQTQPATIVVKRPFFVLFGDGMPKVSLNGRDFVDGGGSLSFGFGNTKEKGAVAELVLRHNVGEASGQ